jgi:hypothetical protein
LAVRRGDTAKLHRWSRQGVRLYCFMQPLWASSIRFVAWSRSRR